MMYLFDTDVTLSELTSKCSNGATFGRITRCTRLSTLNVDTRIYFSR